MRQSPVWGQSSERELVYDGSMLLCSVIGNDKAAVLELMLHSPFQDNQIQHDCCSRFLPLTACCSGSGRKLFHMMNK